MHPEEAAGVIALLGRLMANLQQSEALVAALRAEQAEPKKRAPK